MLLRMVHSNYTHKLPLVCDKPFFIDECCLSDDYKLRKASSKKSDGMLIEESQDNSMNKAVKTVELMFTELLEIVDEEIQNFDIFAELFDSELLSKITFFDDELMLDCETSKVSTIFLEKLFLFYGPELIFKTYKIFESEENLKKYNTEEYANSMYIFINASLKAASYMDDDRFNEIFD